MGETLDRQTRLIHELIPHKYQDSFADALHSRHLYKIVLVAKYQNNLWSCPPSRFSSLESGRGRRARKKSKQGNNSHLTSGAAAAETVGAVFPFLSLSLFPAVL